LTADYVVIHSEAKTARILLADKIRATLQKMEGSGIYELETTDEPIERWILTNKLDGRIRPFSLACYRATKDSSSLLLSGSLEEPFLKIRDHLFSHKDKFYSIGEAIPAGAPPRNFIRGSKYIMRLVNFPFFLLDEIDVETKHQLKKFRGIAVAEIFGLGSDGFHLKIYGDELEDIGLQLTAASYILYTTR
jgi:hypothetical protein